MGMFSYICRGCGEGVRQDEAVVLRHVRHGVVLGQATGHYDGYGSTDAEAELVDGFRGIGADNPNSADEIDRSDGHLHDSVNHPGRRRLYRHPVDGEVEVDFLGFRKMTADLYLLVHSDTPGNRKLVRASDHDLLADDVFECLPFAKPARSGVVAWHVACIGDSDAGVEQSEADPNQGNGDPRRLR